MFFLGLWMLWFGEAGFFASGLLVLLGLVGLLVLLRLKSGLSRFLLLGSLLVVRLFCLRLRVLCSIGFCF